MLSANLNPHGIADLHFHCRSKMETKRMAGSRRRQLLFLLEMVYVLCVVYRSVGKCKRQPFRRLAQPRAKVENTIKSDKVPCTIG